VPGCRRTGNAGRPGEVSPRHAAGLLAQPQHRSGRR
jgi:hypothetical protein